MTKVPSRWLRTVVLVVLLLPPIVALPASAADDPHCPNTTAGLYARIRTLGLDPTRTYHIRGGSISRPGLNVSFDDGTITFTEDICGHISGAFFVGEGEILLQPPSRTERASMALFTGAAILEEQFNSAYLRFNDDTAEVLQPYVSSIPPDTDEFKQWDDASRHLAEYDALRLFVDFSHFLPPTSPKKPRTFPSLLHMHVMGKSLGAFEVFWDSALAEPLWAGQFRAKDNQGFFDIWTSFAPEGAGADASSARWKDDVAINAYRIRASVQPPTELTAATDMDLHIRKGGQRALLFELSRYLKVEAVEWNGHPVDFIQNPAMEGTQLDRRGNDLIAVTFPSELVSDHEMKLRFRYSGDVLSDAGNGLLYVGAKGTWYPNFGVSPATFDLEFRYPATWTLVATGKKTAQTGAEPPSDKPETGEKTSHWISERPLPLAGFNLGKYVRADAKAGKIVVEAYSTKGVESTFPKAQPEVVGSAPEIPGSRSRLNPDIPLLVTPAPPSPANDLQASANKAANSVQAFSQWFGPYPYSSLALTQIPGHLSQGWPGLIFLSSLAFLSPQEQIDLNLPPITRALNSQVLVHETAHQWWGDLILWKTYHDQWIAEGLANYSSLLLLEQENPAEFRKAMDKYRDDLLAKNKDGEPLREAGPVTLGQRLISSHFPNAYEAISYERGTWLFHMLRSMLLDCETRGHGSSGAPNADEPFFRALRKVRDRYAGKAITTRELMAVFEEELPRSLWYSNRHKFDWFVDGWIDGTAIPHLETRDVHISGKGNMTTVSGVIVQKDATENLVTAVPVYGEAGANSLIFLGEVLADGPETSFHFSTSQSIRKVTLDPKQTILSSPK